MRDTFKKRRDLVLRLMKEIPGIKTNTPDGAFYIFPDVSSYFGKSFEKYKTTNSSDLAMYLLEVAQVAIVAGEAFGDDNCIRLSYATSDDKLTEAIKRIKEALEKLA
jgi:aspartate aminotransferase